LGSSLKTPSTFVEYSKKSELKSRQQKLTGTASCEKRNELSDMDGQPRALVLKDAPKSEEGRSALAVGAPFAN